MFTSVVGSIELELVPEPRSPILTALEAELDAAISQFAADCATLMWGNGKALASAGQ